MRQCSPPVRCWSAFGSQILPLVLVINAPGLIRRLFFWAAPLLMFCAPKAFDVVCVGVVSTRRNSAQDAIRGGGPVHQRPRRDQIGFQSVRGVASATATDRRAHAACSVAPTPAIAFDSRCMGVTSRFGPASTAARPTASAASATSEKLLRRANSDRQRARSTISAGDPLAISVTRQSASATRSIAFIMAIPRPIARQGNAYGAGRFHSGCH